MAVKASAAITLSAVVDVDSVTRYYLLQSSTLSPPSKPTANPPTGSWDDAEPTYTSGSTNSLYFCDLTVFSDGTWSYSSVSLSSAYEAAKEAYNKAQNAQNVANAAQGDINSLEIGGRNLVLRSDEEKTAELTTTNKYTGFYYLSEYGGALIDLTPFTISYEYEVTGANAGSTLYAQLNSALVTGSEFDVTDHPRGRAVKAFTPTQTQVDADTRTIRFRLRNSNAGAKLRVWNIKLEKGNRATDWTPAPEDVDAATEAAKQAAEQAQSAAGEAQESANANAAAIQLLERNVSGLTTEFHIYSSGIEATIEDHSEILSAMSFSTEGLKVQMAGSIYYTVTDDVGYHIYQNDKEIASFSEGKGKMDELQMGEIICKRTSKGGWVWDVREEVTHYVNYGYDNPYTTTKTSGSNWAITVSRDKTKITLNGRLINASNTAVKLQLNADDLKWGTSSSTFGGGLTLFDDHTYRLRVHDVSGSHTSAGKVSVAFALPTAVARVTGPSEKTDINGDRYTDIVYSAATYPDGLRLFAFIPRRSDQMAQGETDANTFNAWVGEFTLEDITEE